MRGVQRPRAGRRCAGGDGGGSWRRHQRPWRRRHGTPRAHLSVHGSAAMGPPCTPRHASSVPHGGRDAAAHALPAPSHPLHQEEASLPDARTTPPHLPHCNGHLLDEAEVSIMTTRG
ncbi:hypothetical protein VPH35_013167 [Triticum aestivum]